MKRLLLGALGASLMVVLAPSTAQAANPHEVRNNPIVCTLNSNQTVTCSGSVAGLGSEPVIAEVDVPFGCATRGNENQPGGHLQGASGPIQPRSGRINFSVTTGPASCPPGLNPVVGDTATVTIFDLEGNVLFTTTVPIT